MSTLDQLEAEELNDIPFNEEDETEYCKFCREEICDCNETDIYDEN